MDLAAAQDWGKYQSFVGEGACGRWVISHNRSFLWGSHFYWLCDCKAIKDILEYNGEIAVVTCWAQELLGYHFSVIHMPARMMMDMNGLTRRFNSLSSKYAHIALLLSSVDHKDRPSDFTGGII